MPIVNRTLTFRIDEDSIIHSFRLNIFLFDELASEGGWGHKLKKNIELCIPIEQIQKRIDSLHFGQLLYNVYFVKICNVFHDFCQVKSQKKY